MAATNNNKGVTSMEYRHYIKVRLSCEWQDEDEEIKASPEVFLVVEKYNPDRRNWWEVGRRYLNHRFTLDEAESARQEILESLEQRKAEVDRNIRQPSDPGYDPDFDSVF
jgi:hypothetical protein